MKLLGPLVLAIATMAIAAACGGGGVHPSVEAVDLYLRSFPLDDEWYELTNPRFCEELQDAEPSADKVCIYRDRSDLGEIVSYIWVGRVQSDAVWEFIVQRQGFRWVVLEAQYKGP